MHAEVSAEWLVLCIHKSRGGCPPARPSSPTASCRTALYRRAADDDQELSLRNPDETQKDAAILLGPSIPVGNPLSTVSETVFTRKCLCRFGPPEETEEIGINQDTCDNELTPPSPKTRPVCM